MCFLLHLYVWIKNLNNMSYRANVVPGAAICNLNYTFIKDKKNNSRKLINLMTIVATAAQKVLQVKKLTNSA